MLADQSHKPEHDLLSCEEARGAPCWEGLLGAGDGGAEFGVGSLGDVGDESVCCGVMEIDPRVGLGVDELVVEEVLCSSGGFDGVVVCWVYFLSIGSGGGCC